MTTTDSAARQALDRLVAALSDHLAAAEKRTGEQDPAVQTAFLAVRAAAAAYDDALYDEHDEVTPFDLPELHTDEPDESEGSAEEPDRFALLARWDFSVVDPDLLLAAGSDALREEVDSSAVAVAALAHVHGHSGLVDRARANTLGLHWHGATTWVVPADEDPRSDTADWMDEAFVDIDPDAVLCRFDVPVSRRNASD
ncbi:MAG TPA: hypothetical protein VHU88_04410 [Sporichthyaceae bacterium]|jgi:hypothetical protein|nr:hypothetical protein [Sporichthyaceae bacterium]